MTPNTNIPTEEEDKQELFKDWVKLLKKWESRGRGEIWARYYIRELDPLYTPGYLTIGGPMTPHMRKERLRWERGILSAKASDSAIKEYLRQIASKGGSALKGTEAAKIRSAKANAARWAKKTCRASNYPGGERVRPNRARTRS